MTFEEFKERIGFAIITGQIQLEPEGTVLSELDMAVQYAIGKIGERKGVFPCTVTCEEIYDEILTFSDESIFEKNKGWFYDD